MPTAAPMRAPLPMAAPGNMPDICGLMTYSNAWDDAMPVMGVYTVPTNANQSFELVFQLKNRMLVWRSTAFIMPQISYRSKESVS